MTLSHYLLIVLIVPYPLHWFRFQCWIMLRICPFLRWKSWSLPVLKVRLRSTMGLAGLSEVWLQLITGNGSTSRDSSSWHFKPGVRFFGAWYWSPTSKHQHWNSRVRRDMFGGFLKWGTPKSSILIGVSLINHQFWGPHIYGTPHFGHHGAPVSHHPGLTAWTLPEGRSVDLEPLTARRCPSGDHVDPSRTSMVI